MSGFMVSRNLLLLVGNNTALLFCTDADFDKRPANIILHNIRTTLFCRINGCFIHQILKICTCKTCCCTGNLIQIHIIPQRLALGMHFKDFTTSLNIRTANANLTVETARTKDCRIKNIHTVCSCHNNDALIDTKTIHLYKQLIQCLLTFIVAAAETCSTFSCYRIDLINKNNTRCVLLGIFKKITHSGCTDTYKHFHKVRTGDTEERYTCFSGYRLGQQCLTCSRRSHKDNPLRNTCADFCILLRGLQEINDLLEIFFLFLKTCHITKCYIVTAVLCHLRMALAEIRHFISAAALLTVDKGEQEPQKNAAKH